MPDKKSKKGAFFQTDFLVIDMEKYKYDDSKEYTVGDIKALIKTSLVEVQAETLLSNVETTVFLILGTIDEEYSRFVSYCDVLRDLQKEKAKYVLTNKYWDINRKAEEMRKAQESRKPPEYDFSSQLDLYTLAQNLKRFKLGPGLKPGLLTTALETRVLFKSTLSTQKLDILKGTEFMKYFKENSKGERVEDGEGFNFGFMYDCLRLRKGLTWINEPPKYTKFNSFLKRRGFTNERPTMYGELKFKDPLATSHFTKYSLYNDSVKDEDRDKFQVKNLGNLQLQEVVPLLSNFRSKHFPEKIVNDPYIDLDMQNNVFEVITSKLFVDLKQELTELTKIAGNDGRYVYMTAFLIALNYGYADLRGDKAVTVLVESMKGWKELLFGSNMEPTDARTHKLPCCTNPNHYLEMTQYYHVGKNRRLNYINEDSDGECCFRHMMATYLPQIKLED